MSLPGLQVSHCHLWHLSGIQRTLPCEQVSLSQPPHGACTTLCALGKLDTSEGDPPPREAPSGSWLAPPGWVEKREPAQLASAEPEPVGRFPAPPADSTPTGPERTPTVLVPLDATCACSAKIEMTSGNL